jgi:hypothetical protein
MMYKLTVDPKTLQTILLKHPKCNKKLYEIIFHFMDKNTRVLTHEIFTLKFVIWDEDNKVFIPRILTNVDLIQQCLKILKERQYIKWIE